MPSGVEEAFDPVSILEAFARAGVDFVLIGRVAGGAHGSSYGTFDVDLAYSRDRENLERIAEVLRSLGAVLRGAPADVPFRLDARSLAAGANLTFSTSLGSIDILGDFAGALPYHRLRADAMTIGVRGQPVRVASLDHLIAMKEAAGRPKDKLMATEYRNLSDLVRGADSGSDPYDFGTVKRTSLNLDLELVAQAREVLGTNGTTDTIHRALEDVVRRERLRALAEERFDDLTPEGLSQLRATRTR